MVNNKMAVAQKSKTPVKKTPNLKSLDKNIRVSMYRGMIRIRKFEEGINRVYKEGLMPGLAHLYIGMEAVAIGVCHALQPNDLMLSTHRGHGHLVAKGGDLKRMMAEVLGKRAGYCKGKGGSMHISDPSLGILGANGIVGAGIPIAVGAGLTAKLKKTGQVIICFFGDSASNQGTFNEGLNLASLWEVPVVYICENNLYGISVSQSRHQKIKNIADRAASYSMPGEVVDGNDVETVYRVTKKYVDAAREGKGPALIECKTYRWGGHHVGDPGTKYRPAEEIQYWVSRDPIKILYDRLLKDKDLNTSTNQKIEEEIQNEVEEAVAFAKAAPYPDPEEAKEDILLNPLS